jgi:hypothetical protein
MRMTQSMFQYAIRNEFADGQTLEFVPSAVRPLGLSELTALAAQPDASVTLQWLADSPKINGAAVDGTARLNQRLTFSEPMKIYALVRHGGWLPVPFVSPARFLLDRNVVSNFRNLRVSQRFPDRDAYRLWTAFFDQGAGLFNPLPYAFEGSERRVQSFHEFVQAFEQGTKEIEATFPRSGVVRFSSAHYRVAYAQLQAMHARTPREIAFFCEICPLLVAPTSDARLRSVCDRVLAVADQLGVDRQSLAVVAALSCLFEDPRSGAWSIGRNILKPKQRYEPADAYNAISDLRHIEMAALGHASTVDAQFAFCTSDRAVAALWCVLRIHDVVETVTGPEFMIDYLQELFPRLTEAAINEVVSLLSTRRKEKC